MNFLRRILGILVMIAGILGLVISVAGLVGVWMVKPTVITYVTSTINTLSTSVTTSQEAMQVTKEALGATIDSVDALSVMLESTAKSVEDTSPVLDQVNTLMGKNLPATFESANTSLQSAQQAAVVLDSAIVSLQAFQITMGSNPLLSAFVKVPETPYNPEKPLAQSLGEVAAELEELPPMFVSMAEDMDKADDNLATVESSLSTMSVSVKSISASLGEYENMIGQSQASMANLAPILTDLQNNLTRILDYVVWGLTLFLLWLLAIQIVIFTQGWELFQGTTDRLEGGETHTPAPQAAD